MFQGDKNSNNIKKNDKMMVESDYGNDNTYKNFLTFFNF